MAGRYLVVPCDFGAVDWQAVYMPLLAELGFSFWRCPINMSPLWCFLPQSHNGKHTQKRWAILELEEPLMYACRGVASCEGWHHTQMALRRPDQQSQPQQMSQDNTSVVFL